MEKEKVKLDEVLKLLFSTSNKVLVKLLNGIFNENFSVDEVELTVSNNEFVEDDLGILRWDMFFDILNKDYNKASYHIEFQTKNDNTMIVRMFEYGFKKGKEQLKSFKNYTRAREWLRPSQGPPGVLKFSSGKLMLKHEFVTIFFVK